MVRSPFGDYMMFLDAQPYVVASDTTEIKNLLKKIRQKGIELQRAIQKVRKARLGDNEKEEIDAAYKEEEIDYDRKKLVDKVNKLRDINMKKVDAKKVMKAPQKKSSLSSVSMEKIKREGDKYRKGEYDKEELEFALDNLANIIKRAKDPNMEKKFNFIDSTRRAKRNSMGGSKKPSSMKPKPVKSSSKPLVTFKPAPKKVVAKKVMKPAVKKPMKKPIAYGNVETALTGKRPRKAPAKPKQVARFFVGGSVLPKGTKAPMPKKTTTMKARKPMSAETKLKIKRGVKAYHKNCKEAMAMHSKMMKK